MIRGLIALVTVAGCLASQSASVARSGDLRTAPISVRTAKGEVASQSAFTLVTIRRADGQQDVAEMLCVFVPEAGAFWWTLQPHNPNARFDYLKFFRDYSVVYLGSGKIVSFGVERPFLMIREATETAKSMEDG